MAPQTHTLKFFGLTTCAHCRHARDFLEKHNLRFELVYVDQLEGEARASVLNDVREHNPRISFPTLVIDNGREVIVGFQPEAIIQALELMNEA